MTMQRLLTWTRFPCSLVTRTRRRGRGPRPGLKIRPPPTIHHPPPTTHHPPPTTHHPPPLTAKETLALTQVEAAEPTNVKPYAGRLKNRPAAAQSCTGEAQVEAQAVPNVYAGFEEPRKASGHVQRSELEVLVSADSAPDDAALDLDNGAPDRITSLHHSPSVDHGLGMLEPALAHAHGADGGELEKEKANDEVEEMEEEVYEEEDYDVEDQDQDVAEDPAEEFAEEPEPVAVQEDDERYEDYEELALEHQEGSALEESVAYRAIPSQIPSQAAHSPDRNGLGDSIGTEGEKAIALQQIQQTEGAGRDVDRAEMESMMEAMIDGGNGGVGLVGWVVGRSGSHPVPRRSTQSQLTTLTC